jgi:hypothetical protein
MGASGRWSQRAHGILVPSRTIGIQHGGDGRQQSILRWNRHLDPHPAPFIASQRKNVNFQHRALLFVLVGKGQALGRESRERRRSIRLPRDLDLFLAVEICDYAAMRGGKLIKGLPPILARAFQEIHVTREDNKTAFDRRIERYAGAARQRIALPPLFWIAHREAEPGVGIERAGLCPVRGMEGSGKHRPIADGDRESCAYPDHRGLHQISPHGIGMVIGCRDRAQRNPMVAACWLGGAPLLVAVRNNAGALFHDPPRTTLYRPLAGPCGLRSGMVM